MKLLHSCCRLVGALLILTVSSGYGDASQADEADASSVRGCMKAGQLRVLTAKATCGEKETAVRWDRAWAYGYGRVFRAGKPASDVSVAIARITGGQIECFRRVRTDENGVWTAELWAGQYAVVFNCADDDDLPRPLPTYYMISRDSIVNIGKVGVAVRFPPAYLPTERERKP